jgi:hypothetical protein
MPQAKQIAPLDSDLTFEEAQRFFPGVIEHWVKGQSTTIDKIDSIHVDRNGYLWVYSDYVLSQPQFYDVCDDSWYSADAYGAITDYRDFE